MHRGRDFPGPGSTAASAACLRVAGLSKKFGGVVAVDDLSLEVESGETVGVIGPNGAGKSTLLRLISGEHRPDAGGIWLRATRLDSLPPHRIARAGVALAHQVPRPFGGLTVRDNLRVAASAAHADRRAGSNEVEAVLEMTELGDVAEAHARHLGLLDLKRLGLARALAQSPQLLLLDEVGAGLVPAELERVIEIVRRAQERGVTIVVVEHVESMIRALAKRVLVLDWGRLLASGTPAQVAADPQVRAVYLGEGELTVSRTGRPRTADQEPLLGLAGVSARYGGAIALEGVDLEVRENEIVAVVGANGSGKTTLSKVTSGLKRVDEGTLQFAGSPITRMAAHRRVELGIAHCQEGRRIFGHLSVRENLLMGAYAHRARTTVEERLQEVESLFPLLRERRDQPGEQLSGGQQQMLAIGRSLMSRPRLLILDEVSLGLAPLIVDELYSAIERIRASGVSVLAVEQTVFKSLAIADHVYVLDHGKVVFSGSPGAFESSADLAAIYFGQGVGATGR